MASVLVAANKQRYSFSGKGAVVTSGGVWWTLAIDQANADIHFYYSNDNGATWTEDVSAEITDMDSATPGAAIHIDVDDQIWLTYLAETNDVLTVRVGSISGTSLTWEDIYTTASTLVDDGGLDVVGFREGSGHRVVVAYEQGDSIKFFHVHWDGTTWSDDTYGVVFSGINRSPRVDFHHTGDGKTIQSGTPHLYFAGLDSTNDETRFRKYTWSSGPSWSAGTIRDETSHSFQSGVNLGFYFDGTRAVFASIDNLADVVLLERDAADTAWTDRSTSTPTNPPGNGDAIDAYYDPTTDDIYLVSSADADGDVIYLKYDRAGDSWDAAWTELEIENTPTVFWILRNAGNPGEIHAFWRDLTSEEIRSEQVVALNNNPTAPTINSPSNGSTQDRDETLTIDWTFNDPDAGDTQSAYTLRRQINAGSLEYWNGATWDASESASTKIATSTTEVILAASWGTDGDTHVYTVKTWDAADAGPSPWATAVSITASAQDNPTLTAPTDAGSVTAATDTVSWTVTTQTSFRVVVSDTSSTSNMNAGSLEFDSGWTISASTSDTADFPTNGVTRYVRVQTKNNHGLTSDIDEHSVSVSYSPPTPAVPIVTAVAGQWITIQVNDSSASTDIASYKIHRRVVGDTSAGIALRGATDIPEGDNSAPYYTHIDYTVASGIDYEYRIEAIGDNGSSAFSSWVD